MSGERSEWRRPGYYKCHPDPTVDVVRFVRGVAADPLCAAAPPYCSPSNPRSSSGVSSRPACRHASSCSATTSSTVIVRSSSQPRRTRPYSSAVPAATSSDRLSASARTPRRPQRVPRRQRCGAPRRSFRQAFHTVAPARNDCTAASRRMNAKRKGRAPEPLAPMRCLRVQGLLGEGSWGLFCLETKAAPGWVGSGLLERSLALLELL